MASAYVSPTEKEPETLDDSDEESDNIKAKNDYQVFIKLTNNTAYVDAVPLSKTIEPPFNNRKKLEFLSFDKPLSEPSIEIRYELPCTLKQLINAFNSVLFDDYSKLDEKSFLRRFNAFYSRKQTLNKQSKLNNDQLFVNNDLMHDCQICHFQTTLLPVLGNAQSTKNGKNGENGNGNGSGNDNGNVNNGTMSQSWKEMFNAEMKVNEKWYIDWDCGRATSIVQNETMRSMLAVDEYCDFYQRKGASNNENENDNKMENDEKSDSSSSINIDFNKEISAMWDGIKYFKEKEETSIAKDSGASMHLSNMEIELKSLEKKLWQLLNNNKNNKNEEEKEDNLDDDYAIVDQVMQDLEALDEIEDNKLKEQQKQNANKDEKEKEKEKEKENEETCIIIKKLYFHNPYVSIPSFLTSRLSSTWIQNSNQQMILMIQWLITQDKQFQQQLLKLNQNSANNTLPI